MHIADDNPIRRDEHNSRDSAFALLSLSLGYRQPHRNFFVYAMNVASFTDNLRESCRVMFREPRGGTSRGRAGQEDGYDTVYVVASSTSSGRNGWTNYLTECNRERVQSWRAHDALVTMP